MILNTRFKVHNFWASEDEQEDRPKQQRLCLLWYKRGQAHVWQVQGSSLLQSGVSETTLEEWPQGKVYHS
jgi:hypothetical protein